MKRLISLSVLVVLALAAAGCSSSGGICSKACNKIAECKGLDANSFTCPYSAACTAAEKCQAQCVREAACPAILGQEGSPALAACQLACGGSAPPGDGALTDLPSVKTDQLGPPDGPVSQPDAMLPDAMLPDTSAGADLSGNWGGSWVSQFGSPAGQVSASIIQTGSAISGSAVVTGSPFFSGEYVYVGTVTGDQVQLSIGQGTAVMKSKMTVAPGLKQMSGSYDIVVSSQSLDVGTVQLTRN